MKLEKGIMFLKSVSELLTVLMMFCVAFLWLALAPDVDQFIIGYFGR
tara:strand:+ start:984 stop:1124 length:141 start_codon:yes stop_codon:yes gene_type:complete